MVSVTKVGTGARGVSPASHRLTRLSSGLTFLSPLATARAVTARASSTFDRPGIDRDRDAVIAGLTLPWNSGVVEGHVNRIKMLKRQIFGHASFDLLRKRVLLA
ncbi:hypothetical protein ACFVT5_42050 [Streptomyces sp. NPDC058001]|uniref:hypothetical protein n=1 Tax=Streptomyces sp. NPDC058001 TaxID=3346300 RepID=UPI0036F0DDAA